MADNIQRQHDEIESLKSIYNDIFTDMTPKKKVWNQNASPHFQIYLSSHENIERPVVSLKLDIQFTATYPTSSPIVKVLEPKNLLRARIAQVSDKIDEILREYLGEEVCFTLIMDIKEMLDDFQQTTEQVLSLEQERVKRLEKQRQLLEQQEKETLQKQQSARKKNSMEINKQILQMNRDYSEDSPDPDNTPSEAEAPLIPPVLPPQSFVFDNILMDSIPHSNSRVSFRVVQGFIRCGVKDILSAISTQYIVKPYFPPAVQARLDEKNVYLSYMLTEVHLDDKHWSSVFGKSQIRELELELEAVKTSNFDSVLRVIGFQIDQDPRSSDRWCIRILTEFIQSQISIADILSTAGSVNWALARTWLIQILPSLDSLHNSGLTHRLICPSSVALHKDETEKSSDLQLIKFCHPNYGATLLKLYHSQKGPYFNKNYEADFIPPSWKDPDPSASPVKTDIWQLGVLLIRLMIDYNILETEFRTPEQFLTSFDVRHYRGFEESAERVYDLLRRMVQPKASKRSSLIELNAVKFFRAGVDFKFNNEPKNFSKDSSTFVAGESKDKGYDRIGSSRYQKSVLDAARRNIENSSPHRGEVLEKEDLKIQSHRDKSSNPLNPGGPVATMKETGAVSPANESRYEREFEEVGKLGKGGFGEVVKARSKIEGTFYAIKKIKHKQDKLESLLNEVFSLARLNHQFIVRYYGCWVEELSHNTWKTEKDKYGNVSDNTDSEYSDSDLEEFDGPVNVRSSSFLKSHDSSYQVDYFTNSVASLDYETDFDDRIVFANDSEEERSSVGESAEINSEATSSFSRHDNSDERLFQSSTPVSEKGTLEQAFSKPKPQAKSILYIQMEFCENNTLLDLIERGLPENPNEYWRLLRQILEAVSYIHSCGFIHRDLKPTNIFIDKSNNIKVGDFGLAKNSQFSSALSKNNQVAHGDEDLSTVVGTFFYTAKEVASGSYDEKVDMYSIGIIFFEMCYQLGTGMERAKILNDLRLVNIKFPSDFSDSRKAIEKKLIEKLLVHDPKKRPGALELLQSSLIPVEHQDVVIKEALKSLADPASPWQQQVRETLFNQPYSLARDIIFDHVGKNSHGGLLEHNVNDYLILSQTLCEVSRILRDHGAIQDFSGSFLIPKSQMQRKEQVYELLDRSGSVLTLTYDLVLPIARFLSKVNTTVKKSFTHEFVYRPNVRGTGKPDKYSAVSFDITSHTWNALVFDSAECIKAADEVITSFPCFHMKNSQSVIVINHMDILNSVIEFAFGSTSSLSQSRKYELMGVLSQLGVERGAEEVKVYLRNDFKIQHTVVKDLIDLFNFTVEPERAKQKLKRIMVDSPLLGRVEKALANLNDIIDLAQKFGLTSTISFCPLSNYNARYYEGAVMFQVLHRADRNRKFSRVATGGRYDKLIDYLSNEGPTSLRTPHAVGFQLSITFMFLSMKNTKWRSLLANMSSRSLNRWKPARCDVMVFSSQEIIMEDCGFGLLGELWANNISCDWMVASSYEEAMNKAEPDGINWIVQLKQTAKQSRKSRKGQFKPIRVRNLSLNRETDLDYDEVLLHLKNELEEKYNDQVTANQQGGVSNSVDINTDYSQPDHGVGEPIFSIDLDQRVIVVPNLAKGKKNNKRDKWEVENDSKLAAASMMKILSKAPIVTVDSSDAVLDMISSTSLLVSQDEWLKRAFSSNSNLPRSFGVNIYDTLKKEAEKGTKWAVLHAPKTDKTAIVDLQK